MHIGLDDRLNADMEGHRKVPRRLLLELIEEGLKLGIHNGEAYTTLQLDPWKQERISSSSPRDVDVGVTYGLREGEAPRHHPDDGLILMIQLQDLSNGLWVAIVLALPEFVG